MFALLHWIARLFLPAEDAEDWREARSFWAGVVDAERASFENMARPTRRRELEPEECAPEPPLRPRQPPEAA